MSLKKVWSIFYLDSIQIQVRVQSLFYTHDLTLFFHPLKKVAHISSSPFYTLGRQAQRRTCQRNKTAGVLLDQKVNLV